MHARRHRGQAAAELVALVALVAVLSGGLALAVARPGVGRALARALERALSHQRPAHRGDRWALASYAAGTARRYAPTLVLERDLYGADRSAPVDFALCRDDRCAALGRARPAAFTHVVRRGGFIYIEYWLYYPDSLTDHLPLRALQGAHRDDWEGVIVRVGREGGAAVRATAHDGLAGAAPWWARGGWRPLAGRPLVYRASGSHANGFQPDGIDLAGDRWNGTLGTIGGSSLELLPADEAPSLRRRFDPEASPPWWKRLWRDPEAAGTGIDGAAGPGSAAAAAWAAAWAAAAPLLP